MKRWILFLAASSSLALLDCALVSKSCTLVGCERGVHADRLLAVSTNDLAKLVVTACRNGECSVGSPADTTTGRTLVGPVDVSAFFYEGDNSASPVHATNRIIVDFRSPTNAARDALRDGDTYSLTVTWKDGTMPPLLDVKNTVTYATVYPNGKECDGDHYCKSASLDSP